MTPLQEFNAAYGGLEGPRVCPASVGIAAGDLSRATKIKVTLLSNHQHEAVCGVTQKTLKAKRAPGFIMDVARKAPAACKPPEASDPLRPSQEKFTRIAKRSGYKL